MLVQAPWSSIIAGTLSLPSTYQGVALRPLKVPLMTKKFVAKNLKGGPGASHENHKQPKKSKPHGELNSPHAKQGNTKRTAQGKSGMGPAPWR